MLMLERIDEINRLIADFAHQAQASGAGGAVHTAVMRDGAPEAGAAGA
jgi:hypothetical protein